MTLYSVKPRQENISKDMFFLFTRNLSDKYSKNIFDTASKTGVDAPKKGSNKVVYKKAESAGTL